MAVYLITYDLDQPGQKYKQVHEAIKACSNGAYCPTLESCWLIVTTLTVATVYDRVRAAGMDANDKILVVDVSRDPRQGWLDQKVVDWISNNWPG